MERKRVHGKYPNCKQNLALMMFTLYKLDLLPYPPMYIRPEINRFIKTHMV